MIPKSISASSLTTAAECMARFKATAMERGTGKGSEPAWLGTTLHYALEYFLEPEYVATMAWEWERLLEGYMKGWALTFVGQPMEGEWWHDGLAILQKWYGRNDIQNDILDNEIISREIKETFVVPYWIDNVRYEMPCNFIIDRLDKLDEGVYRVVDYKSQRTPLKPEDLKYKIQPKLYALAVQIKFPDAKEIWVQFDFLRYERVAVLFTKQDNINTWKFLMAELQRIVDTPFEDPPETLNEGCRYCPKRFTCEALQSNLRAGGIFTLSIEQLAELLYQLKGQVEAIKSTIDDVELAMMKHALEEDMTEFDLDRHKVTVVAPKKRVIDRDLMSAIIGPELMKDYGRLNLGDLDALRKDPRLGPAQASLMNTAISYKQGDPQVKVMKKT